jgi:hypothetical protein
MKFWLAGFVVALTLLLSACGNNCPSGTTQVNGVCTSPYSTGYSPYSTYPGSTGYPYTTTPGYPYNSGYPYTTH